MTAAAFKVHIFQFFRCVCVFMQKYMCLKTWIFLWNILYLLHKILAHTLVIRLSAAKLRLHIFLCSYVTRLIRPSDRDILATRLIELLFSLRPYKLYCYIPVKTFIFYWKKICKVFYSYENSDNIIDEDKQVSKEFSIFCPLFVMHYQRRSCKDLLMLWVRRMGGG